MSYDHQGATMIKHAIAGNEAAQRIAYLDYVNDFLTISGFANYYGLTLSNAKIYINKWRGVHEGHCKAIEELEKKDG